MAEKLQLATEESYRDPANIQSKHQKHQAFEAELAANADRIQVNVTTQLFRLIFTICCCCLGCACYGSKSN
jgi:hypothetical protein